MDRIVSAALLCYDVNLFHSILKYIIYPVGCGGRWCGAGVFLLGVPRRLEDWDVAANSLPGGANPAFHFEVRPAVCPFLGWVMSHHRQDLYLSFLLYLRTTRPSSLSWAFFQALVSSTETSDPLGEVLGFW